MKYFLSLLLVFALSMGCNQKPISGKELEDKLKSAMNDYLHATLKDSTEYEIKEMTFYPDKERNIYICSFKVRLRTPASDTTGVMMTTISKDFKKVTRSS